MTTNLTVGLTKLEMGTHLYPEIRSMLLSRARAMGCAKVLTAPPTWTATEKPVEEAAWMLLSYKFVDLLAQNCEYSLHASWSSFIDDINVAAKALAALDKTFGYDNRMKLLNMKLALFDIKVPGQSTKADLHRFFKLLQTSLHQVEAAGQAVDHLELCNYFID
jgi:hypothetical protein